MSDTETTPRSGSGADLSRRLDRLEAKYDELADDVSTLKGIVGRVEITQQHQGEVNSLRFTALETGIAAWGQKQDAFIARFEGIISGEIELPRFREGQQMVADYRAWRQSVEDKFDDATKTPAGKALIDRLDRTEKKVDALNSTVDKNRQWIVGAIAVVGVVAFLVQTFGPALVHILTTTP